MIRKVLRVICVYLIAMCIVSAFKWVFSDVPLSEDTTAIPAQSGDHMPRTVTKEAPPVAQDIASLEPKTSTTSTPQRPPLSLEVTVTKDERINFLPKYSFDSILKTVPPNIPGTMLAELKKRKKFIVRICMRRFCRAYTDREEDNSKWNKTRSHG